MMCWLFGHDWLEWSRAVWVCACWGCRAEYVMAAGEPWHRPSRWAKGVVDTDQWGRLE